MAAAALRYAALPLLALAIVARAIQNVLPPASWVKQNGVNEIFQPRNGHAATVLAGRLWVVGGRSELFQGYNLEYTNRRGDVWSSGDYGVTWEQSVNLWGDFYLQNYDAVIPGPLAPWWERFGHTLNTVEATAADGMPIQMMVLSGGFTPEPHNDVWVSPDGSEWRFAGYAPWSGRAWHASAVFAGKLVVTGGTPLSNDVWVMDRLYQTDEGPWAMEWTQLSAASPWSPRCAMDITVLPRSSGDELFLTGGFGGWSRESPDWDGERSLGDVWKTADGVTWELMTSSAPWGARAWHTVAVWSESTDPYRDIVNPNAGFIHSGKESRMWLVGGGYIGQKNNNFVRKIIAYADTWYSLDGAEWHQVSYEEGSIEAGNRYSSMDWSQTYVDKNLVYRGKWNHVMIAWEAQYQLPSGETEVKPALYIIGGDTDGDGSLSNDVFVSNYTLACSDGSGYACGGVGQCSGFDGCVCPSGTEGDFCSGGEQWLLVQSGAKSLTVPGWFCYSLVALLPIFAYHRGN